MEFGLFAMPSHPPERSLRDGFEWDLDVLRWLDELGYSEAWVGEHHNAPWEPNPAPDLLIAQAFRETKKLRIGPGGFLLPFHHPAELANRVAFLDHISGGRLNFGVAAGSLPGDFAMFHVDAMKGVNREMTREALDIILRLWAEDEPFTIEGKFWTVSRPPEMFGLFKPHIKPVQTPHPPIGVAGLSRNSDTLRLAGERGFLPMSLNMNAGYLSGHWESVEAGAASAGRTARRRDWRIVREVLVADTDEEAWRLAVNGPIARMTEEYSFPLQRRFGVLKYQKHDEAVPDSDVTVEYCAKHNWLIGSPATVTEKLTRLHDSIGGFGTLLVYGFDWMDQPGPWRHSLELLAHEVLPKVRDLRPSDEV